MVGPPAELGPPADTWAGAEGLEPRDQSWPWGLWAQTSPCSGEPRAAPAQTLQGLHSCLKSCSIRVETPVRIQLFQLHFQLEYFSQLLDESLGETEETQGTQPSAQLAPGTAAQVSHHGLKHPLHQEITPCQPVPPGLSKHCKAFGLAPKENNSISVSSRQPSCSQLSECDLNRQTHTQVSITLTVKANLLMSIPFPGQVAAPEGCRVLGPAVLPRARAGTSGCLQQAPAPPAKAEQSQCSIRRNN